MLHCFSGFRAGSGGHDLRSSLAGPSQPVDEIVCQKLDRVIAAFHLGRQSLRKNV